MIQIESRKDLRYQSAQYVLVTREDRVYMRIGNEYLPKAYFNTKEAREILGLTPDQMYELCRKVGIAAQANKRKKIRISLRHMRMMVKETLNK